ncbi:hypothetical protein F4678DRAFT_460162 [Xylaria arbuscula]|nr:hypothetical protein F4678DRAFT_460162 [Xylaria arbuscula]
MFSSSNKFDPNTDIPDLSGRVYVVTGGNSLQKYGDVSRVELIQCDLEDLRQTDEVAKTFASQLQRLDALVLNAGLGVGLYAETIDGLDSHMQVNVIAQHHLARTLLPLLIATPDSRLCFQSSEMHRLGTSGVEFRDEKEINRDIGPTKLYARSKLAQVLLCRGLRRREMRGELRLSPGRAP